MTNQTLDQKLMAALKKFGPNRLDAESRRHRYVMGVLMGEYRGRVDGTRLAQRARLAPSEKIAQPSSQ